MIPGSEQDVSSIIIKVQNPSVTDAYAKHSDNCGTRVSLTVFIRNIYVEIARQMNRTTADGNSRPCLGPVMSFPLQSTKPCDDFPFCFSFGATLIDVETEVGILLLGLSL